LGAQLVLYRDTDDAHGPQSTTKEKNMPIDINNNNNNNNGNNDVVNSTLFWNPPLSEV
jgi:hypothetical protein